MTLKFDGWHWKTPHKLSFVHHSIAIRESKLYSPETPDSGQNRRFFMSRVTLKFDGWPWKTIGHLFYVASSFAVHHSIAIIEFKLELQPEKARFGSKSAIFFIPCDLEIWLMTLKNNRAPLPLCFKLCAPFHICHWCIQTGVTVRKRPIWVKTDDFLGLWP